LFRELAGIAQQIEQNLLEPHGVRSKRAHALLGLNDEAVLVLLGELSRGADDLVDKARQIDRLDIELKLPGFDLREVEYLIVCLLLLAPPVRMGKSHPRGPQTLPFGRGQYPFANYVKISKVWLFTNPLVANLAKLKALQLRLLFCRTVTGQSSGQLHHSVDQAS
jgi:hypothetical protein